MLNNVFYKKIIFIFLIFCIIGLISCKKNKIPKLDKVIIGNIITMNDENPVSNVIGVNNGVIVFVGWITETEDYIDFDTTAIDFRDKSVYPGFFDTNPKDMFDKWIMQYKNDFINLEDIELFKTYLLKWQEYIISMGYVGIIGLDEGYFSDSQKIAINELIKEGKLKILIHLLDSSKYNNINGIKEIESNNFNIDNIFDENNELKSKVSIPLNLYSSINNQYNMSNTEINDIKELEIRKNAISAYTKDIAHDIGQEENYGTIEVGKRANFTVFHFDFYNRDIKLDNEEEITPVATIIDGEMVYSRD